MAELKRNMIELVKEVKPGEVVTKKYLTPMFIPMAIVYEAIDLMVEIDKVTINDEKKVLEKLVDFVADKIYDKQFTRDELFNGLHAPDAIHTLESQVIFVARGMQSEAAKKYLATKN